MTPSCAQTSRNACPTPLLLGERTGKSAGPTARHVVPLRIRAWVVVLAGRLGHWPGPAALSRASGEPVRSLGSLAQASGRCRGLPTGLGSCPSGYGCLPAPDEAGGSRACGGGLGGGFFS